MTAGNGSEHEAADGWPNEAGRGGGGKAGEGRVMVSGLLILGREIVRKGSELWSN